MDAKKFMIENIMILAAGHGSRMRHLVENQPKCLIQILEKPILHYVLEFACNHPFKKIIINTHYLHDQITDAVNRFKKEYKPKSEIIIIYEPELLETGGAIKNAINLLCTDPIFTLNSDVIIQSKTNLFEQMQNSWDQEKMDFLLLMQPFEESIGYKGRGDFEIRADGKLYRPDTEQNYSYMYAGLSILKPELIVKNPSKIFSLKEYYLNNDKVFGSSAPGIKWYHVTRPEDIVDIEFNLMV